jgi:hypothetical protein
MRIAFATACLGNLALLAGGGADFAREDFFAGLGSFLVTISVVLL